MIDVGDLPGYLSTGDASDEISVRVGAAGKADLPGSLDQHEKALVAGALERANGNQSEAARC